MSEPTGQVNTYQARMGELRAVLEKRRGNFEEIAGKQLSADRMIKVVLSSASRNPRLLECTPASMVLAMYQSAELGLEPCSALQEAYLVPYKRNFKDSAGNWQNVMEAQMQPGYRGLVKLAKRSGEVSTITARAVREKDTFRIQYGLNEVLEHTPDITGEPGEIVGFYAIALMRDGSRQFEWMTKSEVDKIKDRSKAKADGPWITDYEAMGKKTVIKRLVKLLPASVELAKAVAIDNAVETGGIASTDETILDGEILGPDTLNTQEETKPTRSAALAEKVGKDKPKAEKPKDDPAKAQDAPKDGPSDELPWPEDEHGAAAPPPAEQPKTKPVAPMSAARVAFLTNAAQAQHIAPVFLNEAIAGLPLLPAGEQKAFLDAVAAGNVWVWNKFEPKVGGAK